MWDFLELGKMAIGETKLYEVAVTEQIKRQISSHIGHLRTRHDDWKDYSWRAETKGIRIWCIEYKKKPKSSRKSPKNKTMLVRAIKDSIESTYISQEGIFDILVSCTKVLGWNVGIEKGQETLRGMTIGTEEYLNAYFKEDKS